MTFQKSILKPISTNVTKKPNTPQVQIDNPLDDDIFINGIELILGAEFSQKGKLLILINEVPVFDENDSKAFFGYAKFPIPLGKTLKRSNDIQISAWNGTDSNTIELKINISLSKDLQPFNTQAETLGKDVFNQIVSEAETLFAEQARAIGTFTKLIVMNGYKKLIVTINKSNPDTPTGTQDITGWAVNPTDLDKTHNGILSDESTDGDVVNVPNKGEVVWDFGSILTRNVNVRGIYQKSDSAVLGDIELLTSTDGVAYTSRALFTGLDLNSEIRNDVTGFFSMRFIKVTVKITVNQGSNRIRAKWNEIFDKNEMGGTGALSFEVKDELGNWNEFIASTEFGTISDGDASIVEQIGDVITKSISGKTYAFPQTQTNFRALYTVSNDAIHNLISVLKVF